MAALSQVFRQSLTRWAISRAMFANANFRGKGEAAFTPDDFLGTGDRNQRGIEEAKEQMAVMRANAELGKMKRGEMPEGLPSWALGE